MSTSLRHYEGTANGSSAQGRAEVERLILELKQNLEKPELSQEREQMLLVRVKELGRDQRNAGPIFSEQSITTLSKYAFDRDTSRASQEAMRCINNAFVLNEETRQTFVNLGYAPKAAERLKSDDLNDEFIITRILFQLINNTQIDFDRLVNQTGLIGSINHHIANHARYISATSKDKIIVTTSMESQALAGTCTLLFTVSHYFPKTCPSFIASIEPLVDIVMKFPPLNPALQPPLTSVLNALLNLIPQLSEEQVEAGPSAHKTLLFPTSRPEAIVERLTAILDGAIHTQPTMEIAQAAAPLSALLTQIAQLAPPEAKRWMCKTILPSQEDREKPLGKSNSLPSRLLRLSSSLDALILRENIEILFFELSDKDPGKLIRNIGFGHASGFLMKNNIDISRALKASGHDDAMTGTINPVTGQKISAEERDTPQLSEMTEDEKLREAERLFVTIERLRATGVADIKNPVQQALDDGKFEELPDDCEE